MSLHQSSHSKTVTTKDVSMKSDNEKNNSFDTKSNKETLMPIINTQGTEIYNDPVFKDDKGIPFTKEDQKRVIKEACRKNVFTMAYFGKCIIFYCTLYSIYGLLGISVMYFYMLGCWNSDMPNLTGKGSFIGLPGINMMPNLDKKHEFPTIKYNINDKYSYKKYTKPIIQFFAKIYNASELFNNKIIYDADYKHNEELKSNQKPEYVLKNRKKRKEIDNRKTKKPKENITNTNDNFISYDQNRMHNKTMLNTEIETKVPERVVRNLDTKIESLDEIKTTTGRTSGEGIKKNIDNVKTSNETTAFKLNEITTDLGALSNISIKDQKIEKFNKTNNLTSTTIKIGSIIDTNYTIIENFNTSSQQIKSNDKIEKTSFNKKDNLFNCSPENDYGYSVGEPCFVIYINNVFNWKKPIFNNLNIPEKYKTDVHKLPNQTTFNYLIPVSCRLKGKEQEGKKYFSYVFPGIIDQSGYYPVTKETNVSKRPYMIVQLKNIPKNTTLQVSCRYYMDVEVSPVEEDTMTLKFAVHILE